MGQICIRGLEVLEVILLSEIRPCRRVGLTTIQPSSLVKGFPPLYDVSYSKERNTTKAQLVELQRSILDAQVMDWCSLHP